MRRQTTLLIGNGLNLAEGAASWNDLIESLRPPCLTLDGGLDEESIPLPIQFEMIGASGGIRSSAAGSDPYTELKKQVRDELKGMGLRVGEAHRRIIGVHPDNVITTNYDYCLEQVFPEESESYKASWGKTKKYTLEISSIRNGVRFFHAHGEQNIATSICIGYEHYIGYVQKMRNHLLKKGKEEGSSPTKTIDSVVTGENEDRCLWPELFFSSDIHIVGFGLGFSEIDFWWLLTLRRAYFETADSAYKELKNNITYYDVIIDEDDDKRQTIACAKKSAKAIALNGLDVIYQPIPANTYPEGYQLVFNKIEEDLMARG